MAEAKGMSLADWFDDLTVRFLLNLPPSELSSIPRLCFQVEEAQWYYEDFVRPLAAAEGKTLPGLPLRAFCLALFQHCPLLSGFTDEQHIAAYDEFLAYKVRVPVRGAILLDESMERVLLVRGWKKGASWSFPRGKINKDEKDLDCAVREVYEETGFDIREAGLVPENEKEAKFIDITMREQHMRMFVFRDVPLDTHFEPRTRKEIGKIDWYNLRDLPGFAKKNRHDGEAGSANKFYMVAPFIGHLKKWIGQQRRKDAAVVQTEEQLASYGLGVHHEVAEESEPIPEPSAAMPVADRSEELKRLLSIGGPAPIPPQQSFPAPPQPSQQPTDLLAMLQQASRAPPPQTPLEQIDAFPQQPATPQPHHPRHPSVGYNQPPPQFPFSPPRVQPQQMQHQQPPDMPMRGYARQPVPGPQAANGMPPHMQQQMHAYPQQQRPNLPTLPPGLPQGQANGFAPPPQRQHYQMQPPQLQPQMPPQMQQQQPRHFPLKGPEGAHGAIAAGPAVPSASQLPAPKLNAHSMSLLNAFKSGAAPSQPVPSAQQGQRQPSVHQTKLLGLFKSPTPSPAEPAAPVAPQLTVEEMAPPPSVQEAPPPPVKEERRPTLNEITRTLSGPFKPMRPSQPSPEQPQALATPPPAPPQAESPPPTEAVKQHEPTRPIRQPRGPPEFSLQQQQAFSPKVAPPKSPAPLRSPALPRSPAPTQSPAPPPPQRKILQRAEQPAPTPVSVPTPTAAPAPAPAPAPATTKKVSRTPASQSPARPARQPKIKTPTATGSRTPTAPFTILTRPGSEKSAATSEEGPKQPFQPQLLKRSDSSELDKAAKPAVEQTTNGVSDGAANGTGKRDHLLALFSKSGAPSPQPPAKSPSPSIMRASSPLASPPALHNDSKPDLLNLFTSSALPRQRSPQPPTPVSQRPQPPRAPSLQPVPNKTPTPTPTQAPPQQPQILHRPAASGSGQQSALLDLFKKPAQPASAKSPVVETPISPFTLGSPDMARFPLRGAEQPRSRLGSVASSDIGGSRRGSGAQTPTPTEAKDFLLGFLNGVVQKEGGRK